MSVFAFDEMPDSRQFVLEPPSLTTKYRAVGELDDFTIQQFARAATPIIELTTAGYLYRQNISVDEVGWRIYEVTVNYGQKKRETGSYSWSFDSTGGSVSIKAAIDHRGSYPSGGDANPHNGSIGVSADGKDVEGAEIIIPALKLSVTFRHPQAEVTMPFVKTLARATGQTNAYEFLTYEPGELLFMGATGSDGSETEAEVTYQFAASENVSDLVLGGIAGIAKRGFDWVWIEFDAGESTDGKPVLKPSRVHVEQVYRELDFGSTFGWS